MVICFFLVPRYIGLLSVVIILEYTLNCIFSILKLENQRAHNLRQIEAIQDEEYRLASERVQIEEELIILLEEDIQALSNEIVLLTDEVSRLLHARGMN